MDIFLEIEFFFKDLKEFLKGVCIILWFLGLLMIPVGCITLIVTQAAVLVAVPTGVVWLIWRPEQTTDLGWVFWPLLTLFSRLLGMSEDSRGESLWMYMPNIVCGLVLRVFPQLKFEGTYGPIYDSW